MLYQELITQVFEKMGPERVAGGRTATGYDWHNCFLAVAFGRPLNSVATAARLTGLEYAEVETIMRMWDRNREAFVALADDWLERKRVPQPEPASVSRDGPVRTGRQTLVQMGESRLVA
jgi:hypothetical protein